MSCDGKQTEIWTLSYGVSTIPQLNLIWTVARHSFKIKVLKLFKKLDEEINF